MSEKHVENISLKKVNLMGERKKKVSIIFEETGERFEIEKRVAIPIIEALRTQKRIKEMPESVSVDMINTAKLLLSLSEIGPV